MCRWSLSPSRLTSERLWKHVGEGGSREAGAEAEAEAAWGTVSKPGGRVWRRRAMHSWKEPLPGPLPGPLPCACTRFPVSETCGVGMVGEGAGRLG